MFSFSFSSFYRFTGCVFVIILGIFALLDSMNGKTYPLYAWRSMIIVEVTAMLLGLVVSTRSLLVHADKEKYILERGEELVRLLKGGGTPAERQATKDKVSQDYLGSVTKHATNFAFFGVLSVTSLWALIQILFVYQYTMDMPGYQSELDRGFPTDAPSYFAIGHKMHFLYIVQLQMVQALAICIIGTAASQASKHQAVA